MDGLPAGGEFCQSDEDRISSPGNGSSSWIFVNDKREEALTLLSGEEEQCLSRDTLLGEWRDTVIEGIEKDNELNDLMQAELRLTGALPDNSQVIKEWNTATQTREESYPNIESLFEDHVEMQNYFDQADYPTLSIDYDEQPFSYCDEIDSNESKSECADCGSETDCSADMDTLTVPDHLSDQLNSCVDSDTCIYHQETEEGSALKPTFSPIDSSVTKLSAGFVSYIRHYWCKLPFVRAIATPYLSCFNDAFLGMRSWNDYVDRNRYGEPEITTFYAIPGTKEEFKGEKKLVYEELRSLIPSVSSPLQWSTMKCSYDTSMSLVASHLCIFLVGLAVGASTSEKNAKIAYAFAPRERRV